MSDEELRQRKSNANKSSGSTSVKLEANSDTSIPSTSSLLVNLLQNKDNLLESSKVSADNEASAASNNTKNKSVLPSASGGGSRPNKNILDHSSLSGANISEIHSSRSQNTQQKSLMPPPSSPLTSGASGTIPTLTGDPANGPVGRKAHSQILINPNTGVLESGPSNSPSASSTASANDPDNPLHHNPPSSDLEAALAQRVKSEKALKLKLKLPNPPSSQPPNSVKSPLASSSSSTSVDLKSSESSASNSQGPKLPKLILSMRDKTVKLSNNKKRSHGEVESTDEAVKAKSPKRTYESDVKSENVQNNARSTKMQPQPQPHGQSQQQIQQPQQNNHCVTSAATSKSLSSNQESSISDGSSSTKKHERLSAWAKSITSRLDKGAFNNAMNHDHDDHEDVDMASAEKPGRTFDLKGNILIILKS